MMSPPGHSYRSSFSQHILKREPTGRPTSDAISTLQKKRRVPAHYSFHEIPDSFSRTKSEKSWLAGDGLYGDEF